MEEDQSPSALLRDLLLVAALFLAGGFVAVQLDLGTCLGPPVALLVVVAIVYLIGRAR